MTCTDNDRWDWDAMTATRKDWDDDYYYDEDDLETYNCLVWGDCDELAKKKQNRAKKQRFESFLKEMSKEFMI